MDSTDLTRQRGDVMRALRLKSGLTAAATARAAGLSPGAYRNYEGEHAQAGMPALHSVARVFGVPVGVILRDPDELPIPAPAPRVRVA